MKATLRRTVLAAALAIAALPAAAQSSTDSPFSQTVFFGDSLTDGGYFRPLLVQMLGPNGAVIGQFTTNPGYVWSQYLADFYGSNAMPAWTGNTTATPTPADGNNWAVGGARNAVGYATPLGYIPSLASQYSAYIASGHTVDPNALYTVWSGANDLFAVQANPSQASAIIGGAVAAQVGVVGALTQAGAQYVLVPTVPDVGLTPDARAGGALGMAQGTALAQAYNDALFGTLASSGLRVIPLDTFHFLQEVVADPAAFGLSNVTDKACLTQPAPAGGSSLFCSPASYLPGGATSYLFADGVHPSTAAHKAVADFAISTIEGPRQIAILPHSAAVVGRARAQMVEGAISGMGRADGDGMQWWADVRGDQQRYNDSIGYDGMGPTASFGIGWRSGNLVYGGFAGYGRQSIDFGQRRGDFDQTEATLGGFVGWQSGAMWANAQLSWTNLDFDVTRQVNLGASTRYHTGSPGGDNLSLGGSAGWNFSSGALTHGPVLSLLSQRISVDGYAENEPDLSTSLAYPDQEFDSLVGSAGWQASYAINDHLVPYARLTWDREFEDAPEQAFAQAQSMPGPLPYAVPGLAFDNTYGTLTYGVRSQLVGLDVTTGSSLTVGQKGGNDSSFFLTVGGRF
jgi:outer membrane lipase/esterase